tara:strand:- start:209 stop:394 length:186 start_codon:yes stop_codon:yes gene_type:complete
MLFKTTKIYEEAEWEEIWEKIPDEELWEDGEINEFQVKYKVINEVFNTGDWILIRKTEDAK